MLITAKKKFQNNKHIIRLEELLSLEGLSEKEALGCHCDYKNGLMKVVLKLYQADLIPKCPIPPEGGRWLKLVSPGLPRGGCGGNPQDQRDHEAGLPVLALFVLM